MDDVIITTYLPSREYIIKCDGLLALARAVVLFGLQLIYEFCDNAVVLRTASDGRVVVRSVGDGAKGRRDAAALRRCFVEPFHVRGGNKLVFEPRYEQGGALNAGDAPQRVPLVDENVEVLRVTLQL